MGIRPYRISAIHIKVLSVVLMVLFLFSTITHEKRKQLEKTLAERRIIVTTAAPNNVLDEENTLTNEVTLRLGDTTEDAITGLRVLDYDIAYTTMASLPEVTTDGTTKDDATTPLSTSATVAPVTLTTTSATSSPDTTLSKTSTTPVTPPTATKSSLPRPLPDCLIVGVRKAGTRALTKFLSLHPQVVVVNHEVQFFNIEERYSRGEDWYRSQMPYKKDNQVLIEKSAEYFHVMEVAERVKSMKPDMKIIVVLRDPFQRMVSDYYFIRRYAEMYNVTYHFAELESSLEDLVVDKDTGRMKFSHGGLHRSEYAKFFKHWRAFFPKKQILVINGDILATANPAGEIQKVERFLSLKPHINDDMFEYNEAKGYFCTKQTGCLSQEKGHVYPKSDPYFEKMVRGYFQHYNNILYQMLGVNFGWR